MHKDRELITQSTLKNLVKQYTTKAPPPSCANFNRLVASAIKQIKKEKIAFVFNLEQFEEIQNGLPYNYLFLLI